MHDSYFYQPAQGHGLAHDPFNAIIGPRPIGWISTLGADGVRNLAPYSFFNAFNYTPPLIGFSSLGRKDTLRNIEHSGEFVWNLATRPLADAMNQSCVAAPPEVDEFALAGLRPQPSQLVQPPRVAESPVAFECRCSQIVRLKTAAGQDTDAWLIMGEVVGVHIARALLKDGVYDTAGSHTILRGGGPADYFEILPESLFRMARPEYPPRG